MIDLFQKIVASYEYKEQNAAAIIAYLLLFLDYCRKHGLLQETSAQPTAPIRKAIDYIQSNFNKKVSLSDMAATAVI